MNKHQLKTANENKCQQTPNTKHARNFSHTHRADLLNRWFCSYFFSNVEPLTCYQLFVTSNNWEKQTHTNTKIEKKYLVNAKNEELFAVETFKNEYTTDLYSVCHTDMIIFLRTDFKHRQPFCVLVNISSSTRETSDSFTYLLELFNLSPW